MKSYQMNHILQSKLKSYPNLNEIEEMNYVDVFVLWFKINQTLFLCYFHIVSMLFSCIAHCQAGIAIGTQKLPL